MESKNDDFDPKNSLVYMNSTAALMETMFKNMKDEDFVYPTKKEVSADEGAIIRSEEHLKRQKESAMQLSYIVRDTYLESVLAKMTDEDFTYGSNTPVDPNYGRVVRALELMELEGTSKQSEPVKIEKKVEPEMVQKENVSSVIKKEETKWQPDVTQQNKPNECHEQGKPGRKSFGGFSKKQNNRNRVKCDLQTWRNDGCSFRKDSENEMKQGYKHRRPSNDQSRSNVQQPGQYFYANPTFSPQNNMYDNYSNNGTPRQSNSFGNGSSSRENRNRYGNGGYNGYNGGSRNHSDRRSMGGQATNQPQMEFWSGAYNDGQQSWRQ